MNLNHFNMKVFLYVLVLLVPSLLTGQSIKVKEKKGEKFFVFKRKTIAGPFTDVEKVYGTSQYLVKEESWRIFDEKSKSFVTELYDSIYHLNNHLYAIKIDNKYGIVDTAGSIIIEPKFQVIDHFSKDISGLVKYDNQWGIYENGEFSSDANQLIFKSPEVMPRFSNCDEDKRINSDMSCDSREMLDFIFHNIRYPEEALLNRISGIVVIKFVVQENGELSDIEIVREIGGGCGEEAVKVVKKMDPWVPGMQDGEKVKTVFYLPVKFAN